MGRRAKRALRETYLRARIESIPSPVKVPGFEQRGGKIRSKKPSATIGWAVKVFQPKHGRFPTQDELCQAVDSGEIGRWIASHYEAKVIKREIVVGGKVIPYDEFCAKPVKRKDLCYADECTAKRREALKKQWRTESENEVIAAAIAGSFKADANGMQVEADRLYEQKKQAWEIEQIFARNAKRKLK